MTADKKDLVQLKQTLLELPHLNEAELDELLVRASLQEPSTGLVIFAAIEEAHPDIIRRSYLDDYYRYYAYRGWLHYRAGHYAEALNDMDSAIDRFITCELYFKRAIIKDALDDDKGAYQDFVTGMGICLDGWKWWRDKVLLGAYSEIPLFAKGCMPEKLTQTINKALRATYSNVPIKFILSHSSE